MAKKRSHSLLLPFLKASVIHFIIFLMLISSFHSTSTEQHLKIQANPMPVIRATAVSSEVVEKLVKQKQQRIDNAARAERDKKNRIKKAAEKKRQAALDKKRNKAAAEKKRKAEAEKKRQQAAEKKRKDEAEKQKKAEEQRRQQQIEKEMQAQMDAEMNAAKEQQILTELQKYVTLIKNKISRNWIIANQTGKCILEVRLGAGGIVIDVREIGGSPAICRSAKAAVYKADPLPVSKDPDVFNKMRNLRLDLDPQEM